MGLDIRTKNDYARFNWSGSSRFIGWSNKHLGLSPFMGWDGGNGLTTVFTDKAVGDYEVQGDVKEAEEWCKALEKYCKKIKDTILEDGQGERIGDIARRMYQLGARETYKTKKIKGFKDDYMFRYKRSYIEWEYIQAIKWYFVLKDAIKNGFIFYG